MMSGPMMNRQFLDFLHQGGGGQPGRPGIGGQQMIRAEGDPIAQRILGLQQQMSNIGRPDMEAFGQAQQRRQQLGSMQERLQQQMSAPTEDWMGVLAKVLGGVQSNHLSGLMAGVEGPTAAGVQEQLAERESLSKQLETARGQDFMKGRDSWQFENARELQGERLKHDENMFGERREHDKEMYALTRVGNVEDREDAQAYGAEQNALNRSSQEEMNDARVSIQELQYQASKRAMELEQLLNKEVAEEKKHREEVDQIMQSKSAPREELTPYTEMRMDLIRQEQEAGSSYAQMQGLINLYREVQEAGDGISGPLNQRVRAFLGRTIDVGEVSDGTELEQMFEQYAFKQITDLLANLPGPASDRDFDTAKQGIFSSALTVDNAIEKFQQIEQLLDARQKSVNNILAMPSPSAWLRETAEAGRKTGNYAINTSEYGQMLQEATRSAYRETYPAMFGEDGGPRGSRQLSGGPTAQIVEEAFGREEQMLMRDPQGNSLPITADGVIGLAGQLQTDAERVEFTNAFKSAADGVKIAESQLSQYQRGTPQWEESNLLLKESQSLMFDVTNNIYQSLQQMEEDRKAEWERKRGQKYRGPRRNYPGSQ